MATISRSPLAEVASPERPFVRAASVWQLAPKVRLYWAFTMPDGSLFTETQWDPLRGSAQAFLWSLLQDPPEGRTPLRPQTLLNLSRYLRAVIRWMISERLDRFAELDRHTFDRFIRALRQRPGRVRDRLSLSHAQSYVGLIHTFYLQRDKLADAPPEAPRRIAETEVSRWSPNHHFPHTPDEIAVPLIAGAIELLGEPADQLLALRDLAQSEYDDAVGQSRNMVARSRATLAIKAIPCPMAQRSPYPEWPLRRLTFVLDRLIESCFVVIAYLVGARVSEILSLKAGCLEWHDGDAGERYAYLVGTITKTAPTEEGTVHRWLAPEPVQRAIEILERLSAPYRARTSSDSLWLHQPGRGRSPVAGPRPTLRLSGQNMNRRLNVRLAPFFNLPDQEGEPWRFVGSQGRKTFARFVGRRDRTGLTALQRHFGHITRAMTDRYYVGTDFELSDIIDAHTADETRRALEDLLLARSAAGKAGAMLVEQSPFRGRTKSGEMDEYIRQILAETDMRLGVCDWGYCLYRRETSACLGGEREPNPVLHPEHLFDVQQFCSDRPPQIGLGRSTSAQPGPARAGGSG